MCIDHTVDCNTNLSIWNYAMCQVVNYRISDEDCKYLTKLLHILPLQNNSWFISHVKALVNSNKKIFQNLVVSIDYVAVDLYSVDDLTMGESGQQWKKFENCPHLQSCLAYVDRMFVISGRHLHERHEHLRNVFRRHSIDDHLITWRWRWNKTLCSSEVGQHEITEKMNLSGDRVIFNSSLHARQCATTMEHVELWHEIALRNFSLVLIFEDDIVFVPFFRDKFNCFIHEVLLGGASVTNSIQPSMLVIGGCVGFHDQGFNINQADAAPVISEHKINASRCSHTYSLTSDSARMLVNEIKRKKNMFSGGDIFLRDMFARSATLSSLWLDPPLVYQGNQISDLNNATLFKNKSY